MHLRSTLPLLLSLLAALPGCVLAIGNRPDQERWDEEGWEVEQEDGPSSDARGADEGEEREKGDEDKERRKLDQDLDTARQRLELARLETQQARIEAQQEVASAELALAKAEADLAHFVSEEKPRRLRAGELSLQDSQDSVRETEEELAQLQMMYGEEELADATAEIVLSRTKRRLERARVRLQLEERELAALREHELPWEQKDKEAALAEARVKLESARLSAQASEMQRRLEEQEAQQEIEELEEKIRESASQDKNA